MQRGESCPVLKTTEQMIISQKTGSLASMFFQGRIVLDNAGQATQYQSA